MYAINNFTENDTMKYKMITTDDKDNWTKMLAYFITLYAMRKSYSEDRAARNGFDISANITHIYPSMSVVNA